MLELSQLSGRALQREAMGTDLDVKRFAIYLSGKVMVNCAERIIDGTVGRSIDASTELSVTLEDYDRAIMHSGLLSNKLDVELDGLWFRLKGVEKSGDNIILKFEDREIALLRTYDKWKIARRSKVTRAQFVLNMIREVKELTIPVVIPELRKFQPVERFNGDIVGIDNVLSKAKGVKLKDADSAVPKDEHERAQWAKQVLKVKNHPATPEQKQNAKIIIATAEDMRKKQSIRRKVIVSAIMTAIVESELINLSGGDGTSAGLFQQIDKGWGSYEDRTDPETATRSYMNHAIALDKQEPNLSYNDLCYGVQRCDVKYKNRYGVWRWEAEKYVNAYGLTGGDEDGPASSANAQHASLPGGGGNEEFFFWRGEIYDRAGKKYRKPENSWSCIQRLADEVDWHAFFVSGTFYFLSEDDMLQQQPMAVITEFMEGITSVDGDVDTNKKVATLTIGARVGRWISPPGSVVVVQNMGPWNGRWIVSEFERSLFDLNANITLTKGLPSLPEPEGGNQDVLESSWFPQPSKDGASRSHASDAHDRTASDLVNLTRSQLAQMLVRKYNAGDFKDDYQGQPDDISQVRKTLNNQRLNSKCGNQVWLDNKVMQVILWLIQQGYKIGVYALCENHDCHTNSGNISRHSEGYAVDISSINGVNIGTDPKAGPLVHAVNQLLKDDVPKAFEPNQLISGGFAGHQDEQCIRQSFGGSYDQSTLNGHLDHIHVGY